MLGRRPDREAVEDSSVDAVAGLRWDKDCGQPNLSKQALLSLTSLLALPLEAEDQVRDNLLQTVVDGCKGGHRAAITTSGPGDRKARGHRADRRQRTSRTDRSHGPHADGGLSSGGRESS